jgi:hypothetical protein
MTRNQYVQLYYLNPMARIYINFGFSKHGHPCVFCTISQTYHAVPQNPTCVPLPPQIGTFFVARLAPNP